MADIFSGLSTSSPQPTATQQPASSNSDNSLFEIFPSTNPTSVSSPVNQLDSIHSPSVPPNVLNATPISPQQPPMSFTTVFPPQQQTNLPSPAPTSPIAPPTVTNPLAGLDLLGDLTSPSSVAPRPAKDSFFPPPPPAKTIQQMQMEKQVCQED